MWYQLPAGPGLRQRRLQLHRQPDPGLLQRRRVRRSLYQRRELRRVWKRMPRRPELYGVDLPVPQSHGSGTLPGSWLRGPGRRCEQLRHLRQCVSLRCVLLQRHLQLSCRAERHLRQHLRRPARRRAELRHLRHELCLDTAMPGGHVHMPWRVALQRCVHEHDRGQAELWNLRQCVLRRTELRLRNLRLPDVGAQLVRRCLRQYADELLTLRRLQRRLP